jgi:hypothetical protein
MSQVLRPGAVASCRDALRNFVIEARSDPKEGEGIEL